MIDILKENWKIITVCALILIGSIAMYSAGCVKGSELAEDIQESELVK